MKCSKAKKLIVTSPERRKEKDKNALIEHLRYCEECRQYYHYIKKLDHLLTQLPQPEPPPFLLTRIKSEIHTDESTVWIPVKKLAWGVLYTIFILLSAFLGNKIGEHIFYIEEKQAILAEVNELNEEWSIFEQEWNNQTVEVPLSEVENEQ